ncbi:MAG: LPS export ABC transporter periplasmic protein LptC [Burkholderiales bacterium]|nr:LPS export ABC transporter periplasmic protein LptC [Burkholderiales bacterium]MDE1926093.1 LPS export ABC transporter periplasmic protein LptC [Burkholderiales bacterium]MDE2159948.1 LPS export ABC transporter periplasmic protein LptC [Burkholderiales bacterium]
MSVELHLPDLPEVPISLGPAPAGLPRAPQPWPSRLRQVVVAYLPLLLMALLALGTWWLVKNSPRAPGAEEAPTLSSKPDYTMNQFSISHYQPDGRLQVRIEGRTLRHFPATDRIEIEDALIHGYAPNGNVTDARARRAISNGDGSEVQLIGAAEVSTRTSDGLPLVVRGELLHLYLVTERISSPQAVDLHLGASEMHAAGMTYDNATRRLDLVGPARAAFDPRH